MAAFNKELQGGKKQPRKNRQFASKNENKEKESRDSETCKIERGNFSSSPTGKR